MAPLLRKAVSQPARGPHARAPFGRLTLGLVIFAAAQLMSGTALAASNGALHRPMISSRVTVSPHSVDLVRMCLDGRLRPSDVVTTVPAGLSIAVPAELFCGSPGGSGLLHIVDSHDIYEGREQAFLNCLWHAVESTDTYDGKETNYIVHRNIVKGFHTGYAVVEQPGNAKAYEIISAYTGGKAPNNSWRTCAPGT